MSKNTDGFNEIRGESQRRAATFILVSHAIEGSHRTLGMLCQLLLDSGTSYRVPVNVNIVNCYIVTDGGALRHFLVVIIYPLLSSIPVITEYQYWYRIPQAIRVVVLLFASFCEVITDPSCITVSRSN